MAVRFHLRSIIALLGTLVVASSAHAVPYTFTVSATASDDSRPQNAKAEFEVTSAAITLKLTNTGGAGQVGGISSVLDGFKFVLSTAPASIALTGALSSNGKYNCVGGTCTATAGPLTDNTTYFSWLFDSSTLLLAPKGFKPNGIVNDNIQTTDGIPNAQHNPYLNGPVTFTFALTGYTTAPSVTSASFYFGTTPDIRAGSLQQQEITSPVPEPGTMALLGSGLVGLAWSRRRRRS
jgi:hypothetical protein